MEQKLAPLVVALVLIALDVLFGYLSAMRQGTLNSSVMRNGLWNKLGEVGAIGVGFIAEVCISVYGSSFVNVSIDVPLSTGICAYIALYELTSIVENIGKMNSYIGSWLVNVLGIDPKKVGLGEVTDND